MTVTKTAIVNVADLKVGQRVRFQHPLSDGGMLRFTAPIVKLTDEKITVRFSDRVRAIPFPPAGGAKYGSLPRTGSLVIVVESK